MSNEEKRSMVERGNGRIPVYRQCELLGIPRSTCYYKKVHNPEKEEFDSKVKALISEIYFDYPFYGKRRIRNELAKKEVFVSAYKVKSLMDKLNIHAIHPKPNLSKPNKQNKKYPYLLRNVEITHANQVWSTDITYIKMATNSINISGFTTTKEVIRLTVTRLRGRFTVKNLHFGKQERRHDNSCCDKKHFFGGFFCPEMLDHYSMPGNK